MQGLADAVEDVATSLWSKPERANADGDKEQRLKCFVGSDQDKEFVVLLPLLECQSSRDFGHVCLAARSVHEPSSSSYVRPLRT